MFSISCFVTIFIFVFIVSAQSPSVRGSNPNTRGGLRHQRSTHEWKGNPSQIHVFDSHRYDNDEELATVYRVARSYDARVPCSPGRIFLDGPEAYVLWLKNDETFLYRFPSEDPKKRNVNINSVYNCVDSDTNCIDETSLFLPRVTERDEGLYRCRVHYQGSSAVDYIIHLIVVVPFGLPRIISATEENLSGAHLNLDLYSVHYFVCVVYVPPGAAPGIVLWKKNGLQINSTWVIKDGEYRLPLKVQITRVDHLSTYSCSAFNLNISHVYSESVFIEVNMLPETIDIRLDNKYYFEEGTPRVVDCVIVGCEPKPVVSWLLNNIKLPATTHLEKYVMSTTVSSLTLSPICLPKDTNLTCRATNTKIRKYQETTSKIHSGFRPRCANNMTTLTIDPESKYVVWCDMEAKPKPIFMTLSQEGVDFNASTSEIFVIAKNEYRSKFIWQSKMDNAGLITCSAVNAVGISEVLCQYTIRWLDSIEDYSIAEDSNTATQDPYNHRHPNAMNPKEDPSIWNRANIWLMCGGGVLLVIFLIICLRICCNNWQKSETDDEPSNEWINDENNSTVAGAGEAIAAGILHMNAETCMNCDEMPF